MPADVSVSKKKFPGGYIKHLYRRGQSLPDLPQHCLWRCTTARDVGTCVY